MRTTSLETIICYVIWTGAIFYSSYCVFRQSRRFHHLLDAESFSAPSTTYLTSVRDSSDYEWRTFRRIFVDHWLWIIYYWLLSCLCQIVLPRWMSRLVMLMFTLTFLSQLISVKFAVFVLTMAVMTILVSWVRSYALSYGAFIATVFIFTFESHLKRKILVMDEAIHIFDVVISWMVAKGLSMSIYRARQSDGNLKQMFFWDLSYLFYFPSCITGPIHLYPSFIDETTETRSSKDHLVSGISRTLQIIFLGFFLDHIHHYLHTHAFQHKPHLISRLDGWSFCGIGYTLTCLFYLKYLVLYGLAESLALFDGVTLPKPPQCVSSLCQSIQLWRTFDRGLYNWLLECFYKPVMSISNLNEWTIVKQILASFICFSCVALWHSMEGNIIAWCTINFWLVLVERVINSTLRKHRRIKCLISSPVFALMVISNIFFLSNTQVGVLFLKRIFTNFPLPFLPTMIVMYAGSFVSFHLQDKHSSTRRVVIYSNQEMTHFMQD